MKKALPLLLLCLVIFASCTPQQITNQQPTITPSAISAYLNIKPDTTYVYQGDEKLMADWIIFNEYMDETRVQRKILTANTIVGEVLQIKDKELTVLYGESDMNNHVNRLDYESNTYALLLKEPLKEGNTWGHSQMDGQNITSEITSMNTTVTVPYGTFTAMEVTTTISPTSIRKEYYVKDVGLIKVTNIRNNVETSSELSEIIDKSNLKWKTAFFYPSPDNKEMLHEYADIVYSTNQDLPFLYNEVARTFLWDKFKFDVKPNMKISKLTYDDNAKTVSVDLGAGVIEAMKKADSKETEELWLQCLVETFANIYDCQQVNITINGQAFKTDRIELAVDQFIPADPSKSKEVTPAS